ncbi:chromosome segregation protein SMC [Xaviernesmea oryzae]|uniref:Chromosome partition protein Smc n=1 Tax=Xaviernesmea oryzae TaxID=464029 RepID=A0A1Q9ATG3_9HYPH|nr:chromosome segregation SMC family protein [Xaviernesmea oryzae]OLP58621.1 chromosome segregation protein SMC [Xaviernesmea oryzae]SEK64534.1 condensin subunit Smc [Xaviernesmea oryzae]
MRFTKLRLVGFKSFVEPSEFVIERGLTGVVGPNGCGKSNLVEALRWVMGESSYKNMRASGMDDVIFSGSGSRPARNMAEVGLFLDNSDRTAPAGFNDSDEIQVTRRIERQNGSVYRINGREARARDVQLLFADASTGARSPSMVGQGRVGELINAKPQARRQLLEEAAGISGLHSRRHEAEIRLRAAEGNLERMDDVLGELEARIEALKRQARQAGRFKTLSSDIRRAEAMLLLIRWSEVRAAEREADDLVKTETVVVAERAQAQMDAAKEQAVAGLKLPALREEEAEIAARLQRAQMARTQMEEDFARLMRRRDELQHRLAQIEGDLAHEARLIADNDAALARLEDEERLLHESLADADLRDDTARELRDEAATELATAEAELSRLMATRAAADAARAELDRSARDLDHRRQKLADQMARVEGDIERLDRTLAARPDPERFRERVAEATEGLEAASALTGAAEAALAEAEQAESACKLPLDGLRQTLGALDAEARTIRAMLAAGAPPEGIAPVLDSIVAARGFETALGAALGEDLESPLDRAAPAHWRLPGDPADDPALPPPAAPLSDHVDAPEALSRRLRQIGVVADAQTAERLQPLLRSGQVLVTREGAVWRWDGHVTGADVAGPAALRLAQKGRLAEVEAQLADIKTARQTAEEALSAASTARAAATAEARAAREAEREAVRTLSSMQDLLGKAEREAGEALRRRAVLAESRAQLAAQDGDAAAQEAAILAARADQPDLTELLAALERQSANVGEARQRALLARAAYDDQARKTAGSHQRLSALSQERATWRARVESAGRHGDELARRRRETEEELAGLAEAPDAFEMRRRAAIAEIAGLETACREAAERLALAEERQRQADRAATDALAALAEAREKRGRGEERLLSARTRRAEIEDAISTAFDCPAHEIARFAGHVEGRPLPEMRQVERELDRLKSERERLGGVNLRAEEEQAELSERLATLLKEREDVIDAVRKLRSAIQSLNREGRERLMTAFEVVNTQFQRLFTHLFGGGTAELQLIESDDPLDAGLEILARPPGKKPQTMTLLSGGEQALTALALIFAVFLTNPAPICVLDEVDAPLDDHNVERYCNLMEEMAGLTETRFVIITHNPITMARMNRLFGVTMAEQGVSQLVSVDLQTAEALRDAG